MVIALPIRISICSSVFTLSFPSLLIQNFSTPVLFPPFTLLSLHVLFLLCPLLLSLTQPCTAHTLSSPLPVLTHLTVLLFPSRLPSCIYLPVPCLLNPLQSFLSPHLQFCHICHLPYQSSPIHIPSPLKSSPYMLPPPYSLFVCQCPRYSLSSLFFFFPTCPLPVLFPTCPIFSMSSLS